MTEYHFFVAVMIGVAWGAFDFARKGLSVRVAPVILAVLFPLGHAPVFWGWTIWSGNWAIDAGYLLPGAIGLVSTTVAHLMFILALRVSPLSVTIPLLALTPAFTAVLGATFLGESLTAWQVTGVVLVVFGAMGLNLRGEDLRHPLRFLRALTRERGSLYMVVTAVGWSITPIMDKVCMTHTSLPLHGAIQFTASAGIMLIVVASMGRLGELRTIADHPWRVAAALAIGTTALGLQFWGINQMVVALLEAVKRTIGTTMAMLLGFSVLRERVGLLRIMAGALMCLGVFLITAIG